MSSDYLDPRKADMNVMLPNEILAKTNEMPWRPLGEGVHYKLLRLDETTGVWTALCRMETGAQMRRHLHKGALEAFQLSGRTTLRGRPLGPGDYVYEPMGALHDGVVCHEELVQLVTYHGALDFLDDDDNTIFSLDWEWVKRDQAGLENDSVSTMPTAGGAAAAPAVAS